MSFPRLPRWMRRRPSVRVPTLLQMEAVECGAAALGMVLAYHGRRVPLETLRTACGVSRDGSKASNLVRAARTYGLDARGYKRQPEGLAELPMPAILHWNFNHFLVLEGICDGRAWLNDPATGPRTVSMDEVDQAFTGVVLTFEPTDAFTPGGEAPSLVRALRDRLRGSERGLLFVVLAGLALVVPGLVEPAFARIFVDDILIGGAHDWVEPLLWAMGATAALAAGLTWLRQTYLMRMEMKIALERSAGFVWHVLRLPITFFTQRTPGDLASRIAINDRVARLLSGQLGTSALNTLVIVFYAALMMQYDPVLTAVTVTVAAGNLLALHVVSRRRVDLNQRLLQERGKLMGAAMGGLQTIETLKATGGAADFFARWAGHFAQVTTAEQALGRTTLTLAVVPPLLTAVGTALLLGLGGVRIIDGVLSIGGLVAFQVLAQRFTGPVNQLVALGSTLQEAAGDVARLDDVLAYPADPAAPTASHSPTRQAGNRGADRDGKRASDRSAQLGAAGNRPQAQTPHRLTGALTLENVTFGYSPLDPPLIDDFTLEMEPGMRVALVGGSGSGKSTVARLVCGLHAPWEGTIRFDGTPRDAVPPEVLVASFAYVDQRITLFEGTIRDNLTLWDPTVPEPDVIRAAKDACIHEAITARPGGYEAAVEEAGRNFSGGQRQRLEIARALVQNPTVLVLDEATSALDPATEARIDAHLRRRGCTCLIIAHRLSTIRDADAILVLDHGRVVQRGTHAHLAATPGPYRCLLNDIA